jgi:hypothetical protein
MMQTSQPRKPRLQLSSLFLQRFVGLLESIVSSGGDGCVVVIVQNGRIRRLQLRLDHDLTTCRSPGEGKRASQSTDHRTWRRMPADLFCMLVPAR